MIGNPPQLENGASDESFDGLLNAGLFNIIRIRSCIWWRMIVLESGHVDIVAIVRMFSPANVHGLRIRVMEFVVCSGRPLNVDPSGIGRGLRLSVLWRSLLASGPGRTPGCG